MWFFLIKAIAGSIIGNATATWFKKTKLGVWFYNKVDSLYNWAAERYNVKVLTELTITGKVAQFGRGAISDVSGKLMTQFANNLEEILDTEGNENPAPSEDGEDEKNSETELNLLKIVALQANQSLYNRNH